MSVSRQVSSATRIEVVTEGILLRRLQTDPELAGVGAVVFDEFHERNLDADVALALCLDAVLRGSALGCVEVAAVVATMLGSERDVLRGGGGGAGAASADIMLRLTALSRDDSSLDPATARRILQGARSAAATVTAMTAAAAGRRRGGGAAAAAPTAAAYDDEDLAVEAAVAAAGVDPLESEDAAEPGRDDSGEAESDTGANAGVGGGRLAAEAGADAGPGAGGSEAGEPATASTVSERRGGSPSGSVRAGASGNASGTTRPSFDSAWREQMSRDGLVGALVAAAYPDRIAECYDRSNQRPAFKLSTGLVVRLPSVNDPLGASDYLAIAEIGGVGPAANWRKDGGGNDTVRSAAGLNKLDIERYLKDMVQERDTVFWVSSRKAVQARRQTRLGCLVLSEKVVPPASDAACLPALLKGFKELGGVGAMEFSKELEAWRQRVIWLRAQAVGATGGSGGGGGGGRLAQLPDLSDLALLKSAATWLAPYLAGVRSKSDLLKLDWNKVIRSQVPRELQPLVDSEAPSHLALPTGTRTLVDYSGGVPKVRCRIQEVFGLAEAPKLAGGRIALTLELLSPRNEPLAVTDDLASFWRNSYPAVLKNLSIREHRHYWPDNPLEAEATRLTNKGVLRQQEARSKEAAQPSSSSAVSGGSAKGAAGKGAKGKKR
ncbi:ATP-dependent RNA helicase hrpB [Tetrabaena socialis]|uniref:ATP-dependent RNA helicase hrpB n=1 Tax=Tetrabaena socialis TaxID=47790 RepID=A0A2J8A808_9CHLO|nr:ATP-dependent RNA helicase hrpB [Tetrabaena socialis]|eukprot:PNH08651.1 ATP-dependent RNA helicase hrpB [Tetrabaena socialis]